MKHTLTALITLSALFLVTACSPHDSTLSNRNKIKTAKLKKQMNIPRWYDEQQVKNGKKHFQTHCASCHKADASGSSNWREKDANGNYPAPPLNGTAHTWHHHMNGLRRTVRKGGVSFGGVMPGFGNKLNNQEIDEVLAWVQSLWSAEIYAAWQKRNIQASK